MTEEEEFILREAVELFYIINEKSLVILDSVSPDNCDSLTGFGLLMDAFVSKLVGEITKDKVSVAWAELPRCEEEYDRDFYDGCLNGDTDKALTAVKHFIRDFKIA